MRSVEVCRYMPAEQDAVIDLILKIQRDEFGVSITAEDKPDLKAIVDFYQSGAGGFWVAKFEGSIVGTIGLKDIGNGQGALRKMFVVQQARGKELGVALMLLDHLIEHAKRKRIGRIFLGTTEKFLAAHRFYEKNGFIDVQKSMLPDRFPLMSVDTKFYCLELG